MRFFRSIKDISPWMDYFRMLQEYERHGYMEVHPEKHEVFISQPALHAMSEGKSPMEQTHKSIMETVRRLRVYAAFTSQHNRDRYFSHPFAVNVVKDDEKHAPIYTVVITSRRVWYRLWTWHDKVETITYND